jgi:DNA gyrase/topoisomerase IV subunit A
MFRRYLLTPLQAPVDGAAGGGAPAAGSAGGPAAGAGSDTSAHDDNGNDDGGDEGGDDDLGQDVDDDPGDDDEELREREELLAALPPEQREKRIKTWNRAVSRKLRKLAPIAEQFRGQNGRYLSADEVRRTVQDAQDWREMDQFLKDNPDVVTQILERRTGKGGGRRADAAPDYQDPFADEANLPLDMTNEASRFVVTHLRQMTKANHELKQEIAALKGTAGKLQQTEAQRQEAVVENRWKTSTVQAADRAGLDERSKRAFINAVWKTFELSKARNVLTRVDLQQVIKRELQLIGGGRRRAVADTARRAEHVTTIPRPANRGNTGPAAPADTNKTGGTIKDARKSFFSRLGQAATPR